MSIDALLPVREMPLVMAGGTYVLERVDPRPGARGWCGVLRHPGGGTTTLGFDVIGDGPPPPDACDGLAVAFLPMVMRRRGSLHVRGGLTRGAVRNLTEYAEAWASWDPAGFGRVVITADQLLDGVKPPAGGDAVCAWSGSLRSTHTLVRHLDALVAGGFRIRAGVHVLGLRRSGGRVSDDGALRSAVAAFEAEELPLLAVQTDATTREVIDPEIGPLPVVAAALHAVGGGCGTGLHARQWPLTSQLRFPRPGLAVQDLLSGDAFAVRADGGGATPPRMVAAVTHHPEFIRVLSDCRDRDRLAPPCGRCPSCSLTALAFAAVGSPAPRPMLRVSASRVALLPLQDPIVAADAEGVLEDWGRGPAAVRAMLSLRALGRRLAVDVRDHWRWACSAAGVSPPWPR